MRISHLVLLLGAALPLASCETTRLFTGNPDNAVPGKGQWQQTEPLDVPSLQVLWERSRATLEMDGYALDPERTRYDEKTLVTRWVTHLAPTRFEGIRRRAHVDFVPSDDKWVVRVCVVRQWNADIDSPSNVAEAQWESAKPAVDVSRGALLLWKIRSGFTDEAAEE